MSFAEDFESDLRDNEEVEVEVEVEEVVADELSNFDVVDNSTILLEEEVFSMEQQQQQQQQLQFDDEDIPLPPPDNTSAHQSSPPSQHFHHLHDMVKNFLLYFHRMVKERNIYQIHTIYEATFNKLTDRFFKGTSWPSAESIAYFVENDEVFLVLYKELYYRHIYSKLTPTLDHRFESWQNYCDLFNLLLLEDSYLDLELPNQWIWDIIDEFIYQFQSFCQYRSKLESQHSLTLLHEINLLKSSPQVWNAVTTLNYLHSLIAKSNIITILSNLEETHKHYGETGTNSEQSSVGTTPLYQMLGYFSLIGLLRLHCLFGDYHSALKILDVIDITHRGLYNRVAACQITLYYYAGFSYLMLRRYQDAIKIFSNILLYLSRTKQFHTTSYQYEQILKKNDQMYALLGIAVNLHPIPIDENLNNFLKEKHGDKLARIERGDEGAFKDLFNFGCPKFVTLSIPAFFSGHSSPFIITSSDTHKTQQKLFQAEVSQRSIITTIKSYLKLYTTIPTSKLATFLDISESDLMRHLLVLKSQTSVGEMSGVPGKSAFSADVDFYIDQNMIHVVSHKFGRKNGEYFIRNILKFNDLIHFSESDRPRER